MGALMVKFQMNPDQIISLYETLIAEPALTDQQRFEAHLQSGLARFNMALYPSAAEHFAKALPLAMPERRPGIIFYLAESLFRNGKYSEAMEHYDAVRTEQPEGDLAQKAAYSLAWCHIKGGSAPAAVPLLKSQAENPASVVRREAVRNLVDLLMNLHRYDEAVTWLTKATHILTGEESIEMKYMRGLALSRLGDFKESLKVFQSFLIEHGKSTRADEARYQMCLVLIAMGRFEEALKELDPLQRRTVAADIREKALYRTGECLFNLGNFKGAQEAFDRVIKEYPKGTARVDALFQMGEIAYQSGNHAEALTAFTTIAETESDLAPQGAFRAGEVLMKAERFEDAVKAFDSYLQRFPKASLREDALFKSGLCHLELKDQAKALAAFSQLRDSQGYFRQEARFEIGKIAEQLGNHPLALQQYRAILDEDPKNPLAAAARRSMGVSLHKSGDHEAAVGVFRQMVKDLAPSDSVIPETRLWLGRSLIGKGEIEEGILEILKVPILFPKSSLVLEAYTEAARAYQGLKQNAKARQMWEEVLKLSPPAPLAAEARAALGN
jgi:TolA-binding protein